MDKRFRQHKTLYIIWDDIDEVMQEIMDDRTYEVSREDFYYMCGCSERDDADYSDDDIVDRLNNYLNVKISSYHVDAHGVWFVID